MLLLPAAVAAAAAALAVAVLLPVRSAVPTPTGSSSGSGPFPVFGLAGVAGLVLHGAAAHLVVLALIVAAVAVVVARMLRRRATARRARATSERVLEICEQLAAELGGGQPPARALAHVATDWPVLAPVAEAHRVGADVPAAFRAVAERPGAGELRYLAAAWQVAQRTGQGLGAAVGRVAEDLRSARATHRVVRGELASARATARLVAGLPLFALLMGSGAGGAPLSFLLREPAGLACLGGGLGFGLAGLWWIEALARDVERPR